MKKILLPVLLACFHFSAADSPDSLLNALKTAKGPAQVKVMNELFREYLNSDPVRALGYSREALDLATSIDDKKGMAASYNNLGVAYRNQGALDVALEYYSKSLEIYQELQNGEGVASTKNNIANIYATKRDFGNALKFYEESHSGIVALGNPKSIMASMNNLGNLHSDLQLYDQALNFYTEAWKLSEKSGKPFADPLTNIGNLFYKQGNYQRAVEYYERALDIERKQNNKLGELALLSYLGETFTKATQTGEAQKYLDQALALEVELQATYYLPQILKSSAENYSRQGKMKEAYYSMVQYDAAREKVYGEESSRKIAQMNTAIELREKEKEIENLQTDDKMKTLELRNIQFTVTAIVLALITLVAVANLVMVRKKITR